MITDKLKKLIFDKLTSDLSGVEIILHDDSLWFIDREKKYWYLEFQKGVRLYWRWQFFSEFFNLFTMERDEFEPLISEWLESVLNCGVTTTIKIFYSNSPKLESVLNCGVTTTFSTDLSTNIWLESALNCGVTTTVFPKQDNLFGLESALNCGVTTTYSVDMKWHVPLESVLNCGVTTSARTCRFNLTRTVDEALNEGVTSIMPLKMGQIDQVEIALNNT